MIRWITVSPALAVISVALMTDPAFALTRAECTERIMNDGGVHGSSQQDGVLSVMVNEDLWNYRTYEVKVAWTKMMICSLAGPGEAVETVDIRSHRTNNVIGEWRGGALTVK